VTKLARKLFAHKRTARSADAASSLSGFAVTKPVREALGKNNAVCVTAKVRSVSLPCASANKVPHYLKWFELRAVLVTGKTSLPVVADLVYWRKNVFVGSLSGH